VFWWESEQHSDDENLRFAWLRAVEWREWPLFLSQPVVPLLLYFYSWTSVIGCLVILTVFWWFIVAPYTIGRNLVDNGPIFVRLKFITSPLMAYFIWQRGETWVAVLALSWPILGVFIVKYFVGFIQAALSFTARGKAAQIGLVQERLMDSLGYDRMQGVGYKRRDVAADDLKRWQAEGAARELTPISFEQIYSGRGADYGQEAQELVDLLVKAGIGVGKYEYRTLRQGYPPRFWRKAAAAANELSNWLEHNAMAPYEDRLAHARQVVNINRLVR
jgi:hypothetical protein